MRKISIVIITILALIMIIFAIEPKGKSVIGVSRSQLEFNKTLPQKAKFTVTGNVGLDTVTTLVNIGEFAIITGVYVEVRDTVESRGDSALFKVKVGGTEIMSDMTTSFKLGVSTAPRAFAFTPDCYYTPLAGGAVTYEITQAAYAGAEGITEGTFDVIIMYILP